MPSFMITAIPTTVTTIDGRRVDGHNIDCADVTGDVIPYEGDGPSAWAGDLHLRIAAATGADEDVVIEALYLMAQGQFDELTIHVEMDEDGDVESWWD